MIVDKLLLTMAKMAASMMDDKELKYFISRHVAGDKARKKLFLLLREITIKDGEEGQQIASCRYGD